MKQALVSAAAAAMLATACATPYAPAPLATNFETSKQHKLQAAAHWNTIAQDVAAKLSIGLSENVPLYVHQNADATSFERAFAGQLITALMEAGHPLMRTPEGAMRVEVETQAVPFAADRPQYRHAGKATALGAGLWALYDIVEYASNGPGKAALLAVGAMDAYAWFDSEFAGGGTPEMEIIVNTSVTDANRYVARNTSVYYVADADQRLYAAQQQVRTKTLRVEGGE
ncbi:hypothetical protein [Thauera phenolivorans]|uniref:hypothetical protein n=1 Tax=Thauera phenolivorans TaxID=1792543 RepID=UPI00083AD0CD|nr:hypothetical protein [Thauera phenolivorans]